MCQSSPCRTAERRPTERLGSFGCSRSEHFLRRDLFCVALSLNREQRGRLPPMLRHSSPGALRTLHKWPKTQRPPKSTPTKSLAAVAPKYRRPKSPLLQESNPRQRICPQPSSLEYRPSLAAVRRRSAPR